MKVQFKKNVQTMVFVGVMAGLLVVFSQLSIPLPNMPVTLQTFGVALCGFILGRAYGPVSVLVYLVLGAVGLPVFAGFSGGIGVMAGMTGGFLWGFLLLAFCCGFGVGFPGKLAPVGCGIVGLLLCHVLGIGQFALVSGMGLLESAALASFPFLIKDVISIVLAYGLSVAVVRQLKKANLLAVSP